MNPADSCWKALKGYAKLGTMEMIRKGHELGFSRQVLASTFGVAFVVKALGKIEGEELGEEDWR